MSSSRSRTPAHRSVRRLRRAVFRGRYVIAALSLGVAAMAAVAALQPDPPPTSPVVVTARDLPAGTVLQPADVTARQMDITSIPDDALTTANDALDHATLVRLPAGMPLVLSLIAEESAIADAPEGLVVVAVRMDPTTAALAVPGARLDLVSGSEFDEPRTLAHRALVLPHRTPAPDTGGVLGISDATTVVLVAVSPDEAPALASESRRAPVGVIVVR